MTARLVGLAAALTLPLTLTACGVPPSDVIQAGEPASGMLAPGPTPSAPAAVSLYFLDDGDLTAYPRKIGDPADLGAVVGWLFGGPTTSEAATATTELPRLKGTPEVTAGSGNTVSIRLPDDVGPLSRPAMLQLACTIAHTSGALAGPSAAQRSPAHTSVHVLGDGWTMSQSADSCPARPQP
ncbi:hypothetical protein [Streptomyces sp. NPDC059979]|uniref:hypothetical protein n=1 Tax=Streptomyces sp. NPDC059979 TaxID=3347021 RepID=UPI0036CEEB55